MQSVVLLILLLLLDKYQWRGKCYLSPEQVLHILLLASTTPVKDLNILFILQSGEINKISVSHTVIKVRMRSRMKQIAYILLYQYYYLKKNSSLVV